jgi:two-component system, OmpR family, sensor kinase
MTENHDRSAKFLSLAVHEFRTPVSVVSGYLRMLLRHYGDALTDQQRALVELGEKSCGSLSTLLAELSDLAQIEAGQFPFRRDPLPLLSLLADVAKDVHEGQDRGITFAVRPQPLPVHVLGDPARLAGAFATLASAVMRERVEATPVEAACRLVDTDTGREARVAIAGATAIESTFEQQDREEFDEYRGGLGFRLVLASRIVNAHGGRIQSPATARGRLALLVSLPVVQDAESIG